MTSARLFAVLTFWSLASLPVFGAKGLLEGKDYRITGCMVSPRLVEGQDAVMSLLAENLSSGNMVLQVGRKVVDGKEVPVRIVSHSSGLRGEVIAPGGIATIDLLLPEVMEPLPKGKHSISVEAWTCRYQEERYHEILDVMGHSTDPYETVELQKKFAKAVARPCEVFGGTRHVINGEVEVVEPQGKDKAYYDTYIRDWVESGDLAVKRQLQEKRNERSKELRKKEPPVAPKSPPFSEIKQRQSFKELEDNRYAALAGYAGGRKVTLLDTVRRLTRITAGRHKYQYSPSLLQDTVSSFDRAEYYLRTYDLQWSAYLARAVNLLGTVEEKRALTAIHEVASKSPNCVARYLANRVLEVYDEVRGGKSH